MGQQPVQLIPMSDIKKVNDLQAVKSGIDRDRKTFEAHFSSTSTYVFDISCKNKTPAIVRIICDNDVSAMNDEERAVIIALQNLLDKRVADINNEIRKLGVDPNA